MEGPSTTGWDGLRTDMLSWVSSIQADVAFDGMLHVLESQSRYQYQLLAGEVLHRASIPCLLPLHDFIKRVAPQLDTSAKTVSEYLCSEFGSDEVLKKLRELRFEANDARFIAGIDSMRYHLGEHPGSG